MTTNEGDGWTEADAARGLTSTQAWTQAHILRCPNCGAWECLSNFEALMRHAPGYIAPAICQHLSRDQHRREVA